MKLYYSDHHTFPLPDGHRFPADKYRRLRKRIERRDDPNLNLLPAPAASDSQLETVHDPDYLSRLQRAELTRAEVRQLGLSWSTELLERARHSAGGTIAAAKAALREAVAVNLAGGTHHASRDKPAGFCVFNDVVVAARVVQSEHRLQTVAIVDADVHQGDGTASIVAGDPSIFAFSIHGARNYPFRKVAGDLDIALPDQTCDDDYLTAFAVGLRHVLLFARPRLVIYLAGADPFVADRFSRLNISKNGLRRRDEILFHECRRGNVPVAVTMAGGYAPNMDDIVDIHEQTVLLASELWKVTRERDSIASRNGVGDLP